MHGVSTTAIPEHRVGKRAAGDGYLPILAYSKLEDFQMLNLTELKQDLRAELDKAEAMLGGRGHAMTASEEEQHDGAMARARGLQKQIDARMAQSTIRTMFNADGRPSWFGGGSEGAVDGAAAGFMATYSPAMNAQDTHRPEYKKALHSFLLSGGKVAGEELVVGADGSGGYQPNASWVMSRATGLAIKKAQMQTNLFAPVATTDPDGTERILGRPVFYDVNAPALPTATSSGVVPILFGDFRQGNIIGVRGGAGINVKILDQPLALQGQLAILAYRRIDSRIRQAEAIQQIKISHS
jgi:hypothetical protein